MYLETPNVYMSCNSRPDVFSGAMVVYRAANSRLTWQEVACLDYSSAARVVVRDEVALRVD